MLEARIEQLKAEARARGLDYLAVVPGPNLVYATGLHFFLSERPIIILLPVETRPPVAVLPTFEAERAASAGLDTFAYTDEEGPMAAFARLGEALPLGEARIGVEARRMRLLEAHLLEQCAPTAELIPADEVFALPRIIKSSEEIAAMRRAVAVAEAAFRAWLPKLKAGMTEREAAAHLTAALFTAGAEGLSFAPIVAAGPNGALPHAVPGDRPFAAGDWVVVDWGAVVDGYASDITRCLVFGQPQGRLREIHAIVKRANEAARHAARPGVTAESVDAAARGVIERAGYGPHFIHRTGHGLGLEAHEPPYLARGNTSHLAPGMTFTIEPGIYLEGVGGVRIEDDVVVTEEGVTVLTTLPRDPFIIEG